MRKIPFSPPDIQEDDINEVCDTLRSGWITTGPKTKLFEKMLAEYCSVPKTICLNSATAGLELVLRLFDIGPGDEVITTPYTYAATANVILHTGATCIFADILKTDFTIDPAKIEPYINPKTKAIIPVDFAGYPCDFDKIYDVLEKNKIKYTPTPGTLQTELTRPLILTDAAHSLGASYKNNPSGSNGDFSVFSFHAVKNLTTGEGGAITIKDVGSVSADEIYKKLSHLSLHGQNKDALSKMNGSWFYEILEPGYKCNMTDIQASLGISQLRRYDSSLLYRKELFDLYTKLLKDNSRIILPDFNSPDRKSSYHLFPIRIKNCDEKQRSEIITKAFEKGVHLNVHFIPVNMHPAYTSLGYSVSDTPVAFEMFTNEITLPLYTKLTKDDVHYLVDILISLLNEI